MGKTAFVVIYDWDNLEDYDLHMYGYEVLGVFDTYDNAYNAIQKIKAQHEKFCSESIKPAENDEWRRTYTLEDYIEVKDEKAHETTITWRTLTNDIGYDCEHIFIIRTMELNKYDMDLCTMSD